MIVRKYESKEEWLNDRSGRITGSRLKDILPGRNGEIKKGRWELIAERLVGWAAIVEDSNEKAMDRGTRLEPEAMARFVKETGKKVDPSLLMWQREDDPMIALSPDGVIGKTAAVEIKCLNAASHVEARVTGKIPKNTAGYEEQAAQYFCVNDKLKTLYFVFYDPRFPIGLDFFYLTISRKDIADRVKEYLEEQRECLKWVRDTVNALTMYSPEELAKSQQVAEELASEHKSDLERVYEGIKERS